MTAAPAAPATAVTPRPLQLLRRARFWIAAAAVVLAIVVGQLIASSAARLGGVFDPASTAPQGARALVRVLQQQGVAVQVVHSVDAARRAGGTLLVDDGAALLTAADWRSLRDGRQRLVVASPSFTALRAVAPEVRQAGRPGGRTVPPRCGLALARRAGSMSLLGVTRSLRGAGATICFTAAGGAGQLATRTIDGTRVLLLADRVAFTNEHVAAAGNAAVALAALGVEPRLVWFAPDPLQFGGTRTLQSLTPPWVTPVAGLLLLAGLAAALWRGRRLGPIVVERLPVAVRSRETVEGRARLYERGRAQLRAADALRIGAIGRMAPMLGLGRSAPVDDVVGAVARTTGLHRDRVAALLLRDEPADDRDLMRISDELVRLEAAVRAASLPPSSRPKGS